MEPDDTADKAASQDLKSKIAYFKNLDKSQQSSQTRQMEPIRKRATSPKSDSYKVASTTTTQITEKERYKLPQRDSLSSSGRKSPQPHRRDNFDEDLIKKIEEMSLKKSSGFSPHEMEVFKKPMCLVSVGKERAIKIVTETVEEIGKITWPMVVVSVAGLYRTGKSYLMNRLAGSTTGFALGDTIESETKGIWVWCNIHPEQSNTVLMLLDTEGLGDVAKGDSNHDNNIFTLATLLCNCLVYNMKGAFDQDAVSKLTFVTEMAKNIRFRGKHSDDNSSLNLILPDFVLCLRDFSLKLYKKGQGKITEDEYLEGCLTNQVDKGNCFNKPRECIRNFFPQRKCFTFPVPGDGDVLENLERLPFNHLSTKFQEASIRFVSFIYNCKPKDLLASKPINGQMFATLAVHYVTAIAHGAIPDVDDAFLIASNGENKRIEKEALEVFTMQMENIALPVRSRKLEKCYTRAQQTTLEYLRKNVVHDDDGYWVEQAQSKMDNIWKIRKDENKKKIKEMCDVELQQIRESLKDNIEKKVYEVVGGHRKFQSDIEKMKEDFMSSLRDFEEHEIRLTWLIFLQTMKETEIKIIENDVALTREEKKAEEKRNADKIKLLMAEQEKSKADAIAEQEKTMKGHYDKLINDHEIQSEKEFQKYKELVEIKLDDEKAKKELKRMEKKLKEKRERWLPGRLWDAFWNE